jgi:hypothetical protein
MNNIGFLAVKQKDGYLLEGKDHAAKIFERYGDARSASGILEGRQVVALRYDEAVQSLLNGSAFCFDCDEGLARFHRRLRNDMAHKHFLAKSQDKTYVRWKKLVSSDSAGAGLAADAAAQTAPPGQSPVEASVFNPAVLVREGNR